MTRDVNKDRMSELGPVLVLYSYCFYINLHQQVSYAYGGHESVYFGWKILVMVDPVA